jgi:hypothetical protein
VPQFRGWGKEFEKALVAMEIRKVLFDGDKRSRPKVDYDGKTRSKWEIGPYFSTTYLSMGQIG